jgi:hypothetical protein
MPLGEVNRLAVKAWVKSLRRSLAEPTVKDVVTLLSMILGEAVEEGLIGANPCRRFRINTGGREEWPHARADQIPVLACRTRPAGGVLIITAAYTGCGGASWPDCSGTGSTWTAVRSGSTPKDGALHEVGDQFALGPPNTTAGA